MATSAHRTLTSEVEIVAYLHRLRMAILGALRAGPATVTQIASELGVHPANLTRHIRTLEEAGLILLVEKRDTGRNLEKYYQAVAKSFDVAPEADNLKSPQKIGLAFARSDLSSALSHLPDRDPRPVLALVAQARISLKDVGRFRRALTSIVESFSAANGHGGESYHLNVCLFPGEIDAAGSRIQLKKKRSKS
jgi:DNA-binding transcriptional ArsR family regulator